ncbi:MAG: sensor histidine kinase [Acidimicrobiales bacterium]
MLRQSGPTSVSDGRAEERGRRRGVDTRVDDDQSGSPTRSLKREWNGALWARLGLRTRVTVMFGLGALLLSASMGGLSYFTTRHFLVSERGSASMHQAYVNASLIRKELRAGSTQLVALLVDADSGTTGSHSVLDVGGQWYARSFSVSRGDLPVQLREMVHSGNAATQTFLLDGTPELAVGVPVPSVHAAYFEVFDISDLSGTLRVLALALFVAGLVTTTLGGAIGRSASGRSLRPLTGVSRAAVAIASGRLDTRLEAASADPDLVGLTTSFNQMVDQLQERIEREARFTSDVSHELRSPLTTLSASLGVLEDHRDELSPTAVRALNLLTADLRRFERMVGDLLEISRSDTGSADVSREEVTAGELIERSVAANVRGLHGDPEPPEVIMDDTVRGSRLWVDKRRFERIMANLLENAAFYGGGATTVQATFGPVRHDGRSTIRVSVVDHGNGLDPSERTRVFERFYRGQASGRRGAGMGSGLGLALVAEHARLNDGSVWAEEAEGGGACFTVEFPIVEQSVT